MALFDERRDGCGALGGLVKAPASFDEIASRFWDANVRSGVQVPLTDQALTGSRASWATFCPMRSSNSLGSRTAVTCAMTSWHTPPLSRRHGRPLGFHSTNASASGDGLSLFDTPYLIQEWGLPDGLVLLSGDGHSWIALDYREAAAEDRPPVIYVDAQSRQVVRLAVSFRHFVEGLIPEPGDDES